MGDRKAPTPPPSAFRVTTIKQGRGAMHPMNQVKPTPPPPSAATESTANPGSAKVATGSCSPAQAHRGP